MKSRINPLPRLSAALAIACSASAHASTAYNWTGTANDTFSNSANWSPGGWTEWNDYHFDATATGNFAINNSTTEYGVGSISLDSGLTNDITISGSRLLMWQGYNDSTGSITIAADSKNLTLNTAYAASGNATWDVGANRTLTFNGVINTAYWGAGNYTKQGAGTAVLSANNTFTGNTTVSNGVLEISSTGKLYGGGYTTSPTISVSSGGTLRLNGWSWDAAGSIANLDYSRDRLVVNGGTIEYTGNSNLNPGDPGSSSRNLTIGTGGATLKASSASGQTWTITSGNGNLVNNTGLTLDGAGAGEIQNVIEGTGTVTKTGVGTWTLSGANTYSGATTIKSGTLKINSSTSISGSSSITVGDTGSSGAALDATAAGFTVGSTQTLGGIGTIFATGQTVTASGTISSGNSVGTLTIDGGTLALNADTDFVFELGTSSDLISLINAATLNLGAGTLGLADFLFSNSGGFGEGVYTLIGGASSFSGTLDSSNVTGVVLGYNSTLSMSGNNLILTVIPEPGAALLGSLGMLVLLRRRR
jgi:autotransporter-associated beta strand protein